VRAGATAPESSTATLDHCATTRIRCIPCILSEAFARVPSTRVALTITAMTEDPLGLVGETIDRKYRVQAFVEETSLSVVYRAVHRVWRRPVAIKAFKAMNVHDEERNRLLAAFVREGTLLMELSERCAAICQARDVSSLTTSRGDWVPYMVLEWLDGESLDAMLARERDVGSRPRNVAEAIGLLEPVARALAVAHERGISHRDVKPGNVYVLTSGCKLLDFGVAEVVRGFSHEGEVGQEQSFTPAYGAPEQFLPDYGATGPWTDVFALALVLVELVTGRAPLGTDTVAQMMARACDPRLRPTPRAMGVSIDMGVERVLARALAVHPHDRFANAAELWSTLKRSAPSPWVDVSNTIPIPLVRRRALSWPSRLRLQTTPAGANRS
jgi:serine/threonine protein kinase